MIKMEKKLLEKKYLVSLFLSYPEIVMETE